MSNRVTCGWLFRAIRRSARKIPAIVFGLPASAAFLAFAAFTQEQAPAPPPAPVVLENSGKPMVVPFQCSEEDIDWAGLTCSEREPCPIYIELSAVESISSRIFTVGNIHSAALTLYSILLASDDSGLTWREPHSRIRGAGLDRIQFADAENGWISGESLSPLPRDPFLLRTSDGGRTWRPQPIFDESRIGSVLQFFFSDKANGTLVFDQGQGNRTGRYQLFASADGGASWTIKEEADKPPVLKRAPAPSDWRLRADAATRAFHIERRSGERWTRVAAFAVNVGACKP